MQPALHSEVAYVNVHSQPIIHSATWKDRLHAGRVLAEPKVCVMRTQTQSKRSGKFPTSIAKTKLTRSPPRYALPRQHEQFLQLSFALNHDFRNSVSSSSILCQPCHIPRNLNPDRSRISLSRRSEPEGEESHVAKTVDQARANVGSIQILARGAS